MRTRTQIGVGLLITIIGLMAVFMVPSVAASGGGHTPVTICHHAGPHPANWHTITVDDDSVTLTAHLRHGDTYGPCIVTTTPTPTVSPTPSAPTPTVTPTVVPSVAPTPTDTITPTPSDRPTPIVVGRPVPTLPPTDTADIRQSSNVTPYWMVLTLTLIGVGAVLAKAGRPKGR